MSENGDMGQSGESVGVRAGAGSCAEAPPVVAGSLRIPAGGVA